MPDKVLTGLVGHLRRLTDPDRDVHLVMHTQMEIAEHLAAEGTVKPQTGRVARVNASDGGVPKLPVDGGAIGFD